MTKNPNLLHNRKKVRTRQILNQSSLYYLNNRRLSFLPRMFLGFSVVVIILGMLWYLNLFDLQTVVSKPANQPSEQLTALDLIRQLNWNTTRESNPTNSHTVNSQNKSPSNPLVVLTTQNGTKCTLSLHLNPPENLRPLIYKEPQGWWLPTNCEVNELKAIQILRLNSEEASRLTSQSTLISLQNLDGLDTYALVYFSSKPNNTNLDLKKYLKSLTTNIFSDRFYFNVTSAHDTKKIGDWIYYLDGECTGPSSYRDPCKLWRSDRNTGTIELLKKDVGNTGKGQVNELTENLVLRFANRQDYTEGINLILLNQKTFEYKLLRINRSQWLVFETITIRPGESLYSVYYF